MKPNRLFVLCGQLDLGDNYFMHQGRFSIFSPFACDHRAKWPVNIGSSNGLKSDGTKPLPEPMLTYMGLYKKDTTPVC